MEINAGKEPTSFFGMVEIKATEVIRGTGGGSILEGSYSVYRPGGGGGGGPGGIYCNPGLTDDLCYQQ